MLSSFPDRVPFLTVFPIRFSIEKLDLKNSQMALHYNENPVFVLPPLSPSLDLVYGNVGPNLFITDSNRKTSTDFSIWCISLPSLICLGPSSFLPLS